MAAPDAPHIAPPDLGQSAGVVLHFSKRARIMIVAGELATVGGIAVYAIFERFFA